MLVLRVVAPYEDFVLTVKVRDPAVFLKYRADRVGAAMIRLTKVAWPFRHRRFTVVGPGGSRVFWVDQVRSGSSTRTRWRVAPRFEDCLRNFDGGFDLEVDPDNVAPPCPA